MMKRQVFLIIALLTTASLFSQKWDHTIGLSNQDEDSRRVIEHYDKGYILTVTTSEGYNDANGWLIKTDINGNVLWDKVIGVDPDQVIIEKTVYDDQGNLYIFGLLWSDLESFYPLIVKLNPCGELQWCCLLYFAEYMYGSFYDGILLENGDLLGVANMPDEMQYDMIWLFCISPDGEFKWKQSYASKENYPMFEMRLGSRIQFFDDIYIISGYVYSPHPNYPTVSSIRPMFIGIDTLFNEKWVLQFGFEDNMKGKALTSIPINDSLFMGIGRYRYVGSSGETMDAWAMLYNDEGEQTGYQIIATDKLGSEITESTFFEVERVNDSVYLATSGYFYGEEEEGAMGEIVFDTAGNVYNYSLREGTAGGNTSIIKTFDNKYAIACSYQYPDLSYDVYFYKVNDSLEQDTVYPGSYTYDSLCPYQIQSGVIDLTGCTVITDIKDIPWREEFKELKNVIEIIAYPNPANDYVIFEAFGLSALGNDTQTKIQIINAFGQPVTQLPVLDNKTTWDCHAIPPGIYFYQFQTNKQTYTGKFLISR
jgi:hypothetical protein